MAAKWTTHPHIPQWLQRIEKAAEKEARKKPRVSIDAAFRSTVRLLWIEAGSLVLVGAGELVRAWLRTRNEGNSQLGSILNVGPMLVAMLATGALSYGINWVGALVLRARVHGHVGRLWVAQHPSIRRWYRFTSWPSSLFLIAFIAILPVTHILYKPPAHSVIRAQIENYAAAGECLIYALLTVFVFRRVNRKCFETARADLILAEPQLAAGQLPAAGAAAVEDVIEDAVPAASSSWGIRG